MNEQREKRIKQLQNLLESTPNDSFLLYALALEFFNTEKIEDAEVIFVDLITNDPEYTATYYHLAKLYEATGEIEKAKDIYRKGIEITQKKRDMHALSELRSALNELEYDE